eukprot:TRINITY_DN38979_c0_g1_i1.p1 TRINITY_DN38979_c0_g1~~TRINITY_DN38979_c0_g1_i1.p1  ORF type:complete len:3665 (+),score=707.60 TRINITY_DN38979_c0_g1_i1:144-11138(+)
MPRQWLLRSRGPSQDALMGQSSLFVRLLRSPLAFALGLLACLCATADEVTRSESESRRLVDVRPSGQLAHHLADEATATAERSRRLFFRRESESHEREEGRQATLLAVDEWDTSTAKDQSSEGSEEAISISVPRELIVSAGHEAKEAFHGTYVLVEDKLANGFPVWKKTDSEHWLYSGRRGHWLVGGTAEKERDFACDTGLSMTEGPHAAALPHEVGAEWQVYNGKYWLLRSSLRVQASSSAGSIIATIRARPSVARLLRRRYEGSVAAAHGGEERRQEELPQVAAVEESVKAQENNLQAISAGGRQSADAAASAGFHEGSSGRAARRSGQLPAACGARSADGITDLSDFSSWEAMKNAGWRDDGKINKFKPYRDLPRDWLWLTSRAGTAAPALRVPLRGRGVVVVKFGTADPMHQAKVLMLHMNLEDQVGVKEVKEKGQPNKEVRLPFDDADNLAFFPESLDAVLVIERISLTCDPCYRPVTSKEVRCRYAVPVKEAAEDMEQEGEDATEASGEQQGDEAAGKEQHVEELDCSENLLLSETVDENRLSMLTPKVLTSTVTILLPRLMNIMAVQLRMDKKASVKDEKERDDAFLVALEVSAGGWEDWEVACAPFTKSKGSDGGGEDYAMYTYTMFCSMLPVPAKRLRLRRVKPLPDAAYGDAPEGLLLRAIEVKGCDAEAAADAARAKPVTASAIRQDVDPPSVATDGVWAESVVADLAASNASSVSNGTCTATRDQSPSWIKVDLQQTLEVDYVKVVAPVAASAEHSSGWTVRVGMNGDRGDAVCRDNVDATGGALRQISCTSPKPRGSQVSIWSNTGIRLCEIMVFPSSSVAAAYLPSYKPGQCYSEFKRTFKWTTADRALAKQQCEIQCTDAEDCLGWYTRTIGSTATECYLNSRTEMMQKEADTVLSRSFNLAQMWPTSSHYLAQPTCAAQSPRQKAEAGNCSLTLSKPRAFPLFSPMFHVDKSQVIVTPQGLVPCNIKVRSSSRYVRVPGTCSLPTQEDSIQAWIDGSTTHLPKGRMSSVQACKDFCDLHSFDCQGFVWHISLWKCSWFRSCEVKDDVTWDAIVYHRTTPGRSCTAAECALCGCTCTCPCNNCPCDKHDFSCSQSGREPNRACCAERDNLAFLKVAEASGVHGNSSVRNFVDGLLAPSYASGCTITSAMAESWLRVDLGSYYRIRTVRLLGITATGYKHMSNALAVHVGIQGNKQDRVCKEFVDASVRAFQSIFCPDPKPIGRYVTVFGAAKGDAANGLAGSYRKIGVCELEAYGEEAHDYKEGGISIGKVGDVNFNLIKPYATESSVYYYLDVNNDKIFWPVGSDKLALNSLKQFLPDGGNSDDFSERTPDIVVSGYKLRLPSAAVLPQVLAQAGWARHWYWTSTRVVDPSSPTKETECSSTYHWAVQANNQPAPACNGRDAEGRLVALEMLRTPVPPQKKRWILADEGESCTRTCAKHGLLCDIITLEQTVEVFHNNKLSITTMDVDNLEVDGLNPGQCKTSAHLRSKDVKESLPFVQEAGTSCAYVLFQHTRRPGDLDSSVVMLDRTKTAQGLRCDAVAQEGQRRLCACEEHDWHSEPRFAVSLMPVDSLILKRRMLEGVQAFSNSEEGKFVKVPRFLQDATLFAFPTKLKDEPATLMVFTKTPMIVYLFATPSATCGFPELQWAAKAAPGFSVVTGSAARYGLNLWSKTFTSSTRIEIKVPCRWFGVAVQPMRSLVCADGSDEVVFAPGKVVGCDFAWQTPGMDSADKACAAGFEICADEATAGQQGLTRLACEDLPGLGAFYAVKQGSAGADEIWGCGKDGEQVKFVHKGDGVLNARLKGGSLKDFGSWRLNSSSEEDDEGTDTPRKEVLVSKSSGHGGVLCCRAGASTKSFRWSGINESHVFSDSEGQCKLLAQPRVTTRDSVDDLKAMCEAKTTCNAMNFLSGPSVRYPKLQLFQCQQNTSKVTLSNAATQLRLQGGASPGYRWTTLAAGGDFGTTVLSPKEFNELYRRTDNRILRLECLRCKPGFRTIFYREKEEASVGIVTEVVRNESGDGLKCDGTKRAFAHYGNSATRDRCIRDCEDHGECVAVSVRRNNACWGCKIPLTLKGQAAMVAYAKVKQHLYDDPYHNFLTTFDVRRHRSGFELYSSLEDALKDENAWRYCGATPLHGVGFPGDCAPSEAAKPSSPQSISGPRVEDWHFAPAGSQGCDYGQPATKMECEKAVQQLAAHKGRVPGRPFSVNTGSPGKCGGAGWGSVRQGCSAMTGGDWAAHFKPVGDCPTSRFQLVCSGGEEAAQSDYRLSILDSSPTEELTSWLTVDSRGSYGEVARPQSAKELTTILLASGDQTLFRMEICDTTLYIAMSRTEAWDCIYGSNSCGGAHYNINYRGALERDATTRVILRNKANIVDGKKQKEMIYPGEGSFPGTVHQNDLAGRQLVPRLSVYSNDCTMRRAKDYRLSVPQKLFLALPKEHCRLADKGLALKSMSKRGIDLMAAQHVCADAQECQAVCWQPSSQSSPSSTAVNAGPAEFFKDYTQGFSACQRAVTKPWQCFRRPAHMLSDSITEDAAPEKPVEPATSDAPVILRTVSSPTAPASAGWKSAHISEEDLSGCPQATENSTRCGHTPDWCEFALRSRSDRQEESCEAFCGRHSNLECDKAWNAVKTSGPCSKSLATECNKPGTSLFCRCRKKERTVRPCATGCTLGAKWCTGLGLQETDSCHLSIRNGQYYYYSLPTRVAFGQDEMAPCDATKFFCAGGASFGKVAEQGEALQEAIANRGVHPDAPASKEPCIYAECPMITLFGAGFPEVNGDYLPAHADCTAKAYGKESYDAEWIGYRHTRTGAVIKRRWLNDPIRGWTIMHNKEITYYDGQSRSTATSIPLDGWVAYPHKGVLPAPQLRCTRVSITDPSANLKDAVFDVVKPGVSLWADMSGRELPANTPAEYREGTLVRLPWFSKGDYNFEVSTNANVFVLLGCPDNSSSMSRYAYYELTVEHKDLQTLKNEVALAAERALREKGLTSFVAKLLPGSIGRLDEEGRNYQKSWIQVVLQMDAMTGGLFGNESEIMEGATTFLKRRLVQADRLPRNVLGTASAVFLGIFDQELQPLCPPSCSSRARQTRCKEKECSMCEECEERQKADMALASQPKQEARADSDVSDPSAVLEATTRDLLLQGFQPWQSIAKVGGYCPFIKDLPIFGKAVAKGERVKFTLPAYVHPSIIITLNRDGSTHKDAITKIGIWTCKKRVGNGIVNADPALFTGFTNVASRTHGGVPFASSSWAAGCSRPPSEKQEGFDACTQEGGGGRHCWCNVNDDKLGFSSSWIPHDTQWLWLANATSPEETQEIGKAFVGIRFAGLKAIQGLRVSALGLQEVCCRANTRSQQLEEDTAYRLWNQWLTSKNDNACGPSWFKENCENETRSADAEMAPKCQACRTCFARGCDFLPDLYNEERAIDVVVSTPHEAGWLSSSVHSEPIAMSSIKDQSSAIWWVFSAEGKFERSASAHLLVQLIPRLRAVPDGKILVLAIRGGAKQMHLDKTFEKLLFDMGAKDPPIRRLTKKNSYVLITKTGSRKAIEASGPAKDHLKLTYRWNHRKDPWRAAGGLTSLRVQYTGEGKPGLTTPEDKWCTLGTVLRQRDGFYYVRFLDAPVHATGLRVLPAEEKTIIDEIQVFGEESRTMMDAFGAVHQD